jgi:hypothetical protein
MSSASGHASIGHRRTPPLVAGDLDSTQASDARRPAQGLIVAVGALALMWVTRLHDLHSIASNPILPLYVLTIGDLVWAASKAAARPRMRRRRPAPQS